MSEGVGEQFTNTDSKSYPVLCTSTTYVLCFSLQIVNTGQIETTQQNTSSHSNPMAKRLFWLGANVVKLHTDPMVGMM